MNRNVALAIVGAIVVLGVAVVLVARSLPPPENTVRVTLRAPIGAVEREVAAPVEAALSRIPNERISTRLRADVVEITVRSSLEEHALLEAVRAAIPQTELPREVMPAVVSIVRKSELTVLALRSETLSALELGAIAAPLVEQLERRDGVQRVEWCRPEEELRISVDAARLKERDIGLAAVSEAVQLEQRAGAEFMRNAPVAALTLMSDVATISIERAPSECVDAFDGRDAVLLRVHHLSTAKLDLELPASVTVTRVPSSNLSRYETDSNEWVRAASVGKAIWAERGIAMTSQPLDAGALVARAEEHLTFFVRGADRRLLATHAETLRRAAQARARWTGVVIGVEREPVAANDRGRIEQVSAAGQRRAITFDPSELLGPKPAPLRSRWELLREDRLPAVAFSFSVDVKSADAIRRSNQPPPGVDVVLRTSTSADW